LENVAYPAGLVPTYALRAVVLLSEMKY
jgi:hypothetical protein